jgi:hypothetical integral membrane protein (TIGR02206 family)
MMRGMSNYDDIIEPFRPYSASHWAILAATALLTLGLVLWGGRASPRGRRIAAWVLAVAMILNQAIYVVLGFVQRTPTGAVQNVLPLHVCDLAVFLGAWCLLGGPKWAFELTYYWGLAGTLPAMIMPELTADFPSYPFIQFFLTHGLIVAAVAYLLAMGRRPRRGSAVRAFIVTNLYAGLLFGVNLLLGSNYMFLMHPPDSPAPLFALPWPWYILAAEPMALGLFLLLEWPWRRGGNRPRRA